MAAVGTTRQSRVSMSVSMSLVQGGAAAGASATGTVLGMLSLLISTEADYSFIQLFQQLLPLRIIKHQTSPKMFNRIVQSVTVLLELFGEFHFSQSCKFASHETTK